LPSPSDLLYAEKLLGYLNCTKGPISRNKTVMITPKTGQRNQKAHTPDPPCGNVGGEPGQPEFALSICAKTRAGNGQLAAVDASG
jgi:hypothetical protein